MARLIDRVPAYVREFESYVPSRPDPALMRQYGVSRLYRLNNNENALGPPPLAREAIAALAHALDLPLTRFGGLSAPDEAPAGSVTALDEAGQPFPVARRGYDHFAA